MPYTPLCDNAFGQKVQFSEDKEEMWFAECFFAYRKCRGRRCEDFEEVKCR